ncbi:MAG: hypothetical protein OEM49_00540 [Myxococcales bacterium]|nr:hypothetical protein [Myxococcales bacterium]MDH5307388.1 hypothetical protein [Myxococcales bacterium]MDH5565614.1 hypothetical protein [Myxococcales bacterium]
MEDETSGAAKRLGGDSQLQAWREEPAGCPVQFGDVVLLSDGSLGVVFMPDQGKNLLSCFELDDLGNLPQAERDREIVIAGWDSIERVIGSHGELPEWMQRRLEPYRRGIVLGEAPWTRGVELLDECEQLRFSRGEWNELTAGARDLVTSLFGPCTPPPERNGGTSSYRILIHVDQEWNTWRCFGPMTHTESRTLAERLPRMFSRPRELRRGVYDASTDAMNKIEIYRHYTKIEELRFTRGQGEG